MELHPAAPRLRDDLRRPRQGDRHREPQHHLQPDGARHAGRLRRRLHGGLGEQLQRHRELEKVLQEAIRVTTPAPNPNLTPVVRHRRDAGARRVGIDREHRGHRHRARRGPRLPRRALGHRLVRSRSSTSARARPNGPVHDGHPRPRSTASSTPTSRTATSRTGGPTGRPRSRRCARPTPSRAGSADLVVFITDGDPTAHNRPSGAPVTGLVEGDATAMRRAAAEADVVKAQGSHVLALGVGRGGDHRRE